MNVRYLAVKAITPLLQQSSSLKYTLKTQLRDCPEQQRPFLQELCYGSMRHLTQLNAFLDQISAKKIKAKDQDVKATILIGIYQLYKLNTPEHAAISETVDVCQLLNKRWATAFVNATLRRFQREQTQLTESLQLINSFNFNHPDWYIEKLKHNWPTQWQDILRANDQHPPLTLRVNTQLVSRETLISKLSKEGIDSFETEYSKFGITLSKPTDIVSTEVFQQGLISVQDEAPQLAAELIDPQNDDLILDACSAPGGKLLHILELTKGMNTEVQGLELEQHRADRIKENFDRLDLQCQIHIADATQKDWWDGRLYDKILLDTPCSATAVIRRNPDIKVMRQSEDIHQLAKLQKQIIANMWAMLAKGGTLVYATCSIFQQENERLIASFCKENEDAIHTPIDAGWGMQREFGRQLFPVNEKHDGFYYAVLKKSQ